MWAVQVVIRGQGVNGGVSEKGIVSHAKDIIQIHLDIGCKINTYTLLRVLGMSYIDA